MCSTDNPPPKVVQGYKVNYSYSCSHAHASLYQAQFNIFYPDLIDKSKAPTYKIVKEPGNDETVILQFSAGPPYEDIAFRIVNREWEFSHKRQAPCLLSPGQCNVADGRVVVSAVALIVDACRFGSTSDGM